MTVYDLKWKNEIDGSIIKLRITANHYLLLKAICERKYNNAKYLIEKHDIDLSFGRNALISLACDRGDIRFVKLLMSYPEVDPSDMDNTCILHSSTKKFSHIARLLLTDPRVDPNVCVINRKSKKYLKYHRRWKHFKEMRKIEMTVENLTDLVYSYVYYK